MANDTNGYSDAFRHDLSLGDTLRVSVRKQGGQGKKASAASAISADGMRVAFVTAAHLVPEDDNAVTDAYVRDVQAHDTLLASVDENGEPGELAVHDVDISADGGSVAYNGPAAYVASDTNGQYDVYVHELSSGTVELVSVSSGGALGNGHSDDPKLSSDGKWVAFVSHADNLVSGDGNALFDVFLRDRQTGTTTRESVSSTGAEGDHGGHSPSISADGTVIRFRSSATNLVPNDTNDTWDEFVRELAGCAPTVAAYCTPSTTSIGGCQASMSATGVPSLSNPAGFSISSGSVPGGGNFGFGYFGVSGPAMFPLGTQGGFLCVQGPHVRVGPYPSGGTSGVCDGNYSFTLADMLNAAPQGTVLAGSTIHTAVWFRDPASADGFGLSDGLWFQVCP